ncbi:hypothetical protein COL922a_014085, partial [Colletotrichum nupharicola]
ILSGALARPSAMPSTCWMPSTASTRATMRHSRRSAEPLDPKVVATRSSSRTSPPCKAQHSVSPGNPSRHWATAPKSRSCSNSSTCSRTRGQPSPTGRNCRITEPSSRPRAGTGTTARLAGIPMNPSTAMSRWTFTITSGHTSRSWIIRRFAPSTISCGIIGRTMGLKADTHLSTRPLGPAKTGSRPRLRLRGSWMKRTTRRWSFAAARL